MSKSIAQIGGWIYETLFTDEQFDPRCFEDTLRVYQTEVDDPLLLTIINGRGKPAPLTYNQIMDALRQATGEVECYCFYVNLIDNAVAGLVFVEECRSRIADYFVYFEKQPAPQGGVSYLGLLSAQRKWLLMHEHNPNNDFTITLHGTSQLCYTMEEYLTGRFDHHQARR